MHLLLALLAPLIKLFNNIFDIFKKSASEAEADEYKRQKKKHDKEIEEAKNYPH